MKIKAHFPGGSFEIERHPLSSDRFEAICWMIGGGGFMYFVYMLLTSTVR